MTTPAAAAREGGRDGVMLLLNVATAIVIATTWALFNGHEIHRTAGTVLMFASMFGFGWGAGRAMGR